MTEKTPTDPPVAAVSVLDGWLSREELGAQLGLSASTLKRWEGSRTGPPCVRVGRRIVYRLEAVRDWLREQEARKQPSKSGGRR
jgi:predicted DNA-binding transcriptional regulator AlpA